MSGERRCYAPPFGRHLTSQSTRHLARIYVPGEPAILATNRYLLSLKAVGSLLGNSPMSFIASTQLVNNCIWFYGTASGTALSVKECD